MKPRYVRTVLPRRVQSLDGKSFFWEGFLECGCPFKKRSRQKGGDAPVRMKCRKHPYGVLHR